MNEEKFVDRVAEILKQIRYREDWKVTVFSNKGHPYLQLSFWRKCAATGNHGMHKSRKWQLSEHMTKSEIVQTVFKAVLTAEEHEIREHFFYRDCAIFGPHFDVDLLVSLTQYGKPDVRAEPTA